MWRVGLLLLGVGATLSSVQAEKSPEQCKATEQDPSVTCTFDMESNNNVILEAEGDIDEGCMFKYTSSDEKLSCCYIKYPIGPNSNLCNPKWNDEKCRDKKTYDVVEKRVGHIAELCILNLYNVHVSDAGEYKAVFPSDRNHDRLIHMMSKSSETSSGMGGAVIALITVGVILAVCALCALYRFCGPWTKTVDWWKKMIGKEVEPSRVGGEEGVTIPLQEVNTGESASSAANVPAMVVPYKTEYCNRDTQFVATAHCKECSKYMCEDCKESHRNNEPGHQVTDRTIQCDCKDILTMRYGQWRAGPDGVRRNWKRKYFECEKKDKKDKCEFRLLWAEGPLSADTERQRDQN